MEFEVPKFCYRRPKQNEYCNNPQVNKYLSIYRNAIPQPKKIYFCAVDIQSILLEKITNYPHLLLFLSANLVEICQQWQLR